MKVLAVVEDDRDMQLLIELTFSDDPRMEFTGHARTAEEALALTREAQPDLIVLDHFIDGDITGLEVAPQLKAVAAEAKIILFSSHDLTSESRREPAVDAFVSKHNLDRLLPTARSLLGLAT